MFPRLFCLVSDVDDLSLLPALAQAGVGGFQVRAKSLGGRDLVSLTETVIAAVRPHDAAVVVNDRLDVALAAGADGVHLGADDIGVPAARRVAPHLLIGATCRTPDDVQRATDDGADYAGFGPVFATTSKTGLPAPRGLEALGAVRRSSIPVLAIGGIDATNAAAAKTAGAHGSRSSAGSGDIPTQWQQRRSS